MLFFLGTHESHWLARTNVPLFVSRRRLAKRKTLPLATCEWALDSGGFTELGMHGGWSVCAMTYSSEVRRFRDSIGGLLWAAPQDWMCEPVMIHGGYVGKRKVPGTKLSVREHQRLTVANYLLLRRLSPDLPWVPVLQGWEHHEYLGHVEMYGEAGIDLATLPLVGLGSVCRRQDTGMAEDLVRTLHGIGIKVHAFGFKLLGLRRCAPYLTSADSLAWSLDARNSDPLPGCDHKSCANCMRYALRWREKAVRAASVSDRQGVLF